MMDAVIVLFLLATVASKRRLFLFSPSKFSRSTFNRPALRNISNVRRLEARLCARFRRASV